jgi:hypothetical protein
MIDRRIAVLLVAVVVSGCSGGASVPPAPGGGTATASPTPAPNASATPAPGTSATPSATATATPQHSASPTAGPSNTPGQTPTPAPTKTPAPAGTMNATQVSTALTGVETYFAGLPHVDAVADIASVATHMVASGAFKAATVTPGGIDATLPDGTEALVFADHPETLAGSASSAKLPRAVGSRRRNDPPIGPATNHEIAFLVNETDTSGAFVPARQSDFELAFEHLGFGAAGYGTDFGDASLENIVALGHNHPMDFFDLATHGMVGIHKSGPYYANLSTTPINLDTAATYFSDVRSGKLIYAAVLAKQKGVNYFPSFAFTSGFVAEHLTFNPGAIYDNESCFGQSPLIATTYGAALRAAGVGRYLGWTKAVNGTNADQSDAFLLDRMLGEQSGSVTGLDVYAAQRKPAQRPFPLDAIEIAMQTETRAGPFGTFAFPYTISPGDNYNVPFPPAADTVNARLVFSDFGGENVPDPPIFYALPSIEFVVPTEGVPNAILSIFGTFPTAKGSVFVMTGGSTTTLPIRLWTPTRIDATLPLEGPGASGTVIVDTAASAGNGILSNGVPLTQWGGVASYKVSETMQIVDGFSGTGTGALTGAFKFHFRADVHPSVVLIDSDPELRNLSFNNFESDSYGSLVGITGSFTPNPLGPLGTKAKGTFSQGSTKQMFPFTGGLAPANFGTSPLVTAAAIAAGCNNGMFGPQATAGYTSCRTFAFEDSGAIKCVDNVNNALCRPPGGDFLFDLGGPFTPGYMKLTMNPQTYAISVTTPVFPSYNGVGFYVADGSGGLGKETASFTLSVAAPLSPPDDETTAVMRGRK